MGQSGRRVCKITQSAVRFEVIYDVCGGGNDRRTQTVMFYLDNIDV